ncbi:NAD-dependent epimerase/dehydratase family protein [Tenacibaculum amylolyticum]|uniref:NAD-dependent epimerase/dehydratase family protein n=1 Tax=Tenacibaculum amylolyticum TaxID=104269 RepID=UPI0038934B00
MKRIFVTGINGLLGTNLCHSLINKGFEVTGLVRNKNSFKGKQHKNLKLLEGNLFDDFSLLFNNIDIIIHTAAVTNQNLIHYSEYFEVNSKATIQLYNTAITSNVKQFIFVSTANTLGYGTLHFPGTENNKMNSLFRKSFYAKSKFEAENFLLKNKNTIATIIVNPTFMLGAYDTKPSSGKIILMGWKKKLIFYPPGGKNFVHVKDVALGIVNAIDYGVSGEKYLLANENMSYQEFFISLNKVTNQKTIMIKIPKLVLIIMGYFGDILRWFHIRSSLSSVNMKILCVNNYFSNSKSKKELKITYVPIESAIKDSIGYFQENT